MNDFSPSNMVKFALIFDIEPYELFKPANPPSLPSTITMSKKPVRGKARRGR